MKNTGIVIFSHLRVMHLKKLLNSLVHNNTDLPITVYIDKYEKKPSVQNELKNLIEEYNQKLNISEIILRPEKFGLKKNILCGINRSFKLHDKLIILEEDLILGKHAISYFQDCLEIYENSEEIYHVNGWSKPLANNPYEYDLFLTSFMQCSGWATWKNAWLEFEQFLNQDFVNLDKSEVNKIDLDGNLNNVNQLIKNNLNFINTWAVYWQLYLFKNNKLSISPFTSQTFHGGIDDLSTHSFVYEIKQSTLQNNKIDSRNIQKDTTVYEKLLSLSYDKKSKMNIKNITFLHIYQTLVTKLYKMFLMTFIGRFKLRVKDKNILSAFV